ncbi:DUF2085 domain-containing protein [soil metagenome]
MPPSAIFTTSRRRRMTFRPGWPAVFIALCVLPVAVFLALPWSIEGKSLAVLHGLCAQQPGHSFYYGDSRLPFDARMTGIYGGFGVSSLFFLIRRRWGQGGLPSIGVAALLALGVVALGIDGLNSTLLDLGVWHLYNPANELRLATGLLTGVALATFVWLLVGQVAMRDTPRSNGKLITGYRELGAILTLATGYAAIVLSNWEPLRLPLTALLIVSATIALTGLSLAFVLLVGRRENRATRTADLAAPATVALLTAFAILALTSGSRFILEAIYGIPAVA